MIAALREARTPLLALAFGSERRCGIVKSEQGLANSTTDQYGGAATEYGGGWGEGAFGTKAMSGVYIIFRVT